MLVALHGGASAIKSKVVHIERNQARIVEVRQLIEKHLVSRVSAFFFVLNDMGAIRRTYQFSLKWFMNLYNEALRSCRRHNTGTDRLQSLTMHFTEVLHRNVGHSLFEDDKLPFAILMLSRFMVGTGQATHEEANLLLYGRATEGKSALALLTDSNAASSGRRSSSALGPSFYGSAPTPKAPTPGPSRFAAKPLTPSDDQSTLPAEGPGDMIRCSSSSELDDAFGGMFVKRNGSNAPVQGQRITSKRPSKADTDDDEVVGKTARDVVERVAKEIAAQHDEYDGDRSADPEISLLKAFEDASESEGGRQQGEARESSSSLQVREESSDVISRAAAAAVSPGGLLSGHSLITARKARSKASFSLPKQSGPSPSGLSFQSNGSVNELLELSAPAHLPRDMRPDWLSLEAWDRVRDLGKLIPYNKILGPLFSSESAAAQMERLYYDLLEHEVHKVELPSKLKDLTPFQLMLFTRCFQVGNKPCMNMISHHQLINRSLTTTNLSHVQPGAFISAARAALNIHLGPSFSHSDPLDMSSAFLVSDCSTPIVLISSIDQPLPQV